jgi:hypothetical protein
MAPVKQQIVINTVFPGQAGNIDIGLHRQFYGLTLEFRGILSAVSAEGSGLYCRLLPG